LTSEVVTKVKNTQNCIMANQKMHPSVTLCHESDV